MTAPDGAHHVLVRRATRGAATMLAARFLAAAIALGTTALLARHLTPDEFGLVSMALSVLVILRSFEEFGLGDAMVQRETIDDAHVSGLFWLNVAAGACLAVVFAAAAPLIAGFYRRDDLVAICLALAPLTLLGAMGAQHRAVLRRTFRFRRLAIAQTISVGVGSAAGIAAAFLRAGAWALVFQSLAASLTLLVATWIGSGWRPSMPRRIAGLGPMVSYGMHLGAAQLLNAITRNLDNILIGRCVGGADLGVYGRAFQLMELPATQLNQPMSPPVVATLSRLQSDSEGYRRFFRGAAEAIASTSIPIAVFTAAAAPAVVGTVLGPRWLEAAPILQALAPAGLMASLNVGTGWVYLSLGRTDRQLRWRIVGSTVTVVGIVCGLPWGAIGVALGVSAARVIVRVPAVFYCFHGTFLRPSDLSAVAWRPALAAGAAGAMAFLADPTAAPFWQRLIAQAALFAAAYLGTMALLPGGWARLRASRDLVLRSARSGIGGSDG